METLVITNNPRVHDYFLHNPDSHIRILFLDSRKKVFITVRDYIHKNYALLNHALSGNIAVHKQPYRSMALIKTEALDVDSLVLWETAVERMQRSRLPQYSESVLQDFQELDFQLFINSVR